MIWPVLGLLVLGFLISLPACWCLIRVGHRAGALDSVGSGGHRKAAIRNIPNIGGVAVFLAVVGPMLAGLLAVRIIDEATWQNILPGIVPHLGRIGGSAPTALALVACLTILHITGLVDDRRGLGPFPKLAVQVGAALVLATWFDVRLLTLLPPWLSILITVLWIVAITNAINFMDNMDGLAAGVSAIAAAMFLAATLVNAQWFIAATLALLIGALIGFLVFNFPPAKIFLGDGGSLVVGFLLAVLTARTTFWGGDDPSFALGSAWYGVLMPLIVLAVPIYDLVTVTAIRLKQGKSPFVGDQQHYSHRLVERGLSERGAVVVIWCATVITGIGGVGLGRLQPWQAVLVGVQTAAVLITIALLEHVSRRAVDPARGRKSS